MMKFADIKGNAAAVSALRTMVDSGRVPHAILLHEDPHCGAMSLALAFVSYLNCSGPVDGEPCGECPSCRQMAKLVHPDVHYVFPVNKGDAIKSDRPVSAMGLEQWRKLCIENPLFGEQDLYEVLGIESKSGNISVFEAKEILDTLSLSSVTGGTKSVVIFLPERLNPAAANKLLKILEEPPENTLFILITNNPDDVMKTIFSRCQFIRVLPPERSAIALVAAPDQVRQIWENLVTALLSRNLLDALSCADALDALKSREKQKTFCAYAASRLRGLFLLGKGLDDLAYIGRTPLTEKACKAFSSKFYTRTLDNLDRAAMLIGRNVSAKMVFTDLVNRMYVNL